MMMNKVILTIVFFVICVIGTHGKDKDEYNIRNIPEHLLKDADAVIRNHQVHFQIYDIANGTTKIKKVITLLNKNAKEQGVLYLTYDQFSAIKNLKVVIYDQSGKELKELKKSDFYDQSHSGYDDVDDSRIIYADLTDYDYEYPFTIEYEYEKKLSALMFYPNFVPLSDNSIAVELAEYSISFPHELTPRYKEVNFSKYNIQKKESEVSSSWEMKGQPAIKDEDKNPYFSEIIPYVLVAPSKFKIDGIEGDMSSWNEYSKWTYELNKNRDNLPSETVEKLKSLTSGAKNDIEKIKIIYDYLQESTRYVSIQLGIGGWQTFPAEMVDRTGWGDCKALSNYTKALLKAIDIPSYQALVRAGDDEPEIEYDFPSQTFNHVILYVPVQNDTIWLECTNQENPFNYLGSFTGDRFVLPITENGSNLIRTPKISEELNLQTRRINAKIYENGNAHAEIITDFQGLQYENNGIYYMVNRSYEDQKKWMLNTLDLTGFELIKFDQKLNESDHPVITQTAEVNLLKFASLTGKRFFFSPNMMNSNSYVPKITKDRKFPVRQYWSYTDIDEITYEVPEAFYPEFLPEPIEIKSEFGDYRMEITHEQGKIVYRRFLKMKEGEFPPETYDDYREFRKKIKSADNIKVVLMSKT